MLTFVLVLTVLILVRYTMLLRTHDTSRIIRNIVRIVHRVTIMESVTAVFRDLAFVYNGDNNA